jgi:hypothetical protein
MFKLPVTVSRGVDGQPVASTIDEGERFVLTVVGVGSMIGGAAGGIVLATQLDGDRTVQAGFWSALLGVAAISTLPLVATTTQLFRLWFKSTWLAWTAGWVVIPMLGAAALGLTTIVLCLYQQAVTSGAGNPSEYVVYTAIPFVGLIAGAAVFGVAAGVLDKINTE